ncbi:anti-Muellerian hormone type-2 receptor-like [Conger conger]|uniref:anti-Muellerian hormone type-2 receptor-like n=1 Tax=Conger conger TaxID=82655 RepID=UPI002A5AB28F|nr:anti-Muellerian hormone type-2 receptor-like [Conger conger]
MLTWPGVFALLGAALPPAEAQQRRCAYLARPNNARPMEEAGNVSGAVQRCGHTPCCMGYFRLSHGPPIPDLLGCNVVPRECPESSCSSSHQVDNFTHCVCSADLCNANLTWLAPPPPGPASWGVSSICTVLIPMALLLLLCMVMCHRSIRKSGAKPSYGRVTSQCSCHGSQSPDLDLTCIELHQMVGQGYFASVWSGSVAGAAVAVKVFPARSLPQCLTERSVYSLALLEHAGVLRFLGAGSVPHGPDRFLVLELATQGSLRSFLCQNSSSWACTLRLAQGVAQGLAFLHSDFHRKGMHKPSVAHGDISSSNAVVRADGSSALCDYSCSTILCSCSPLHQHSNVSQVSPQMGTLCYRSPEVLDGCVNLRSSHYLLQGDVYALGLLFWELCSRCADLCTGPAVPEHQLPYEAELGGSPSLGELVDWVSERRERPHIPPSWGVHFQGTYTIKEVLEDCWDHDPEARLTAQSAARRLATLSP